MKLSKFERLMLVNQFKILERLYPDESDYYQVQRKALEWGYARHYKDLLKWISDEMSKEDCDEIVEIIDLHRVLYSSYSNLVDKGNISLEDIGFRGFDGNVEAQELLYTVYCMHDLDGYQELRGGRQKDDFSSHSPMLGKYRRMLKVWSGKSRSGQLSKEDIEDIIGA